jgi:uncharacterized protein (UPF0333 family)
MLGKKGQSSLEYLVTYGWAFILIATVMGVVVFLIGSSASTATFSSSEPAKILLNAGTISPGQATIKLQNITGGQITVSGISPSGANYSSCTLNGMAPNIDIVAGGSMELECPLSGADPTGAITLTYTDFAGLQRNTIIRVNRGTATLTQVETIYYTQNTAHLRKGSGFPYAVVRAMPPVVSSSNAVNIGQQEVGCPFSCNYTIFNAYPSFDTSTISGTVVSAELGMKTTNQNGNFHEIYLYTGNCVGAALDPGDWGQCVNNGTFLGTFVENSSYPGYFTFKTFDVPPSAINVGGLTEFELVSTAYLWNNPPNGNSQLVGFYVNSTQDNQPYLKVTTVE